MNREVKFIESFEGRVPWVYKDSRGKWTIGIGVLVDPSVPGAGLRNEEMEFIAANRIRLAKLELEDNLPWYQKLGEVRQMVLVSMVYQMGMVGVLKFKKALAAMNKEDFDTAALEMLNSDWALQTPHRARDMAWMMIEGQFL